MFDIDSEILITLVEARPVLWDKTKDIYKDRNLTRNAWNEVCSSLHSEFEELGDKERNAFGKDVIRRWTHIRDSFAKSLKKTKECKSSGSAAKRKRLYVYHDVLQFLKKMYVEKETSDSLDGADNVGGVEDTETQETQSEANTFKKTTSTRSHKRVDEVELKILKALEPKEPPKPDPNMFFFQSLLPHLKKFNEEEILQFQMAVLQAVSNINEKKRGAMHPPQPNVDTNYWRSHTTYSSFSQPLPHHPQQFFKPAPKNTMPQQYNHPPNFQHFPPFPTVPSSTQHLTTDTPSQHAPQAHCSTSSPTHSNTSENDDYSSPQFFGSEATNSPMSMPSSPYSIDFSK